MEGCVAAMNGVLIKTIVPAKTEDGNLRAFFSGHYHHYGINVYISKCLVLCLSFLPIFF